MCIRDRKTTAKEDDSWSMTDWLLLGGAAVGAYAVYSNWGLSLIHISEPTRPY